MLEGGQPAVTFRMTFLTKCQAFLERTAGGRGKRPQRRRLEISPPEMGCNRPPPALPTSQARGREKPVSGAPGCPRICRHQAGGVCNHRTRIKKKKSKPAWATEIQRQFLPLDRRTMFSRNVFCGATSPRRPPAMVILPTAGALGASGAVSHRSRRPGAQPASVPGSTRPMRPAAPERRGGGWLPLPPSLRSAPPRCGPPGCALECPGLDVPRPPPVGGGSQPVQGAPYRARIPRGPSRSREPPGEAGTRAAPSGRSGKCVQSAPGGVQSRASSFLGEVTHKPVKVTKRLFL